jgi:hypothetical protein
MTPASSNTTVASQPLRWRGMLIPAEHGSWSLLLEPVVLGCLVVPSAPGFALGGAALALLLAWTPLEKLAKRARDPRGVTLPLVAYVWTFGWLALAVSGLAFALRAAGPGILLPLALALPLVILQLEARLRRRPRRLESELGGALAMSVSAPMIALAGGFGLLAAALLWLLPALRVTLSILFVRARLRLDRGQATRVDDVLDAHVAAVVVLFGLAAGGWLPGLAAVAFLLLGLHAMLQLLRSHGRTTARRLGVVELSLGVLFVMMTAVGYHTGF